MDPRLLLSLYLLAGVHSAQGAAELHVCTLGNEQESLAFTFDDGSAAQGLEAPNGYISIAHLLPAVRSAEVFLAPTEAGQKNRVSLGKTVLPSTGRHLLLVAHPIKGTPKTHIIAFDAKAQPKGGVSFLNLTSRIMRCFIEAESVELDPGEVKLMPTVSAKRRVVSHRSELKTKDGWKVENSTTLILSANRRFLFIFQEDSRQSSLRRSLVTDFDPDRNLAPLEPAPVTAEPPLPDPPAK
jgi:hypothetical protein